VLGGGLAPLGRDSVDVCPGLVVEPLVCLLPVGEPTVNLDVRVPLGCAAARVALSVVVVL
jgi:hypothetical protein